MGVLEGFHWAVFAHGLSCGCCQLLAGPEDTRSHGWHGGEGAVAYKPGDSVPAPGPVPEAEYLITSFPQKESSKKARISLDLFPFPLLSPGF